MFWWFHRTCAIGSVEFMICSRIERSYLQRARKLTIVNRLSAPITKTSIAIAASMIMAGGRRRIDLYAEVDTTIECAKVSIQSTVFHVRQSV